MFGIDFCFLSKLVPDLNAKGTKFTFPTQVLFPFIGKKTERQGAGFKQSSGELGQWKEL